MKRAFCLFTVAVVLSVLIPSIFAQDCLFKTKDDESLKQALNGFHEVMAGLVHGPADKGDFSQVRAKAEELGKARAAIMASNLPTKLAARCGDISAKAALLSKAVDNLIAQTKAKSDDQAIKGALEGVHNAYRDLNSAQTSLEDLLQAFHTVLHPLWHEAYPKKDTAAIKEGIPKLKVRAKLILATAEAIAQPKAAGARKLLDTVTTLEEAAAAKDDMAILESLRIAHDAYEALAEGGH